MKTCALCNRKLEPETPKIVRIGTPRLKELGNRRALFRTSLVDRGTHYTAMIDEGQMGLLIKKIGKPRI